MLKIRNYFFVFFVLTQFNVVVGNNVGDKIEGLKHPYLFFSKSDLPEIRDRMTREPFLTRWEIFKQNADKVLNTSAYVFNKETKRAGRARTYLENAGKTSFAYIITGEEKYAKRAIEEAMAIIVGFIPEENGEPGWYNPAHRSWNKGADLNTAEVTYALAMVYDWCYDALTDAEKEKIKNAIVEKGLKHYLNSIERDNQDFWVGNPVTNWEGVVSGGMGLGALAIYNESEDARRAAGYARKYIPEFLNHVFLEDGGGHEGIMYARYGELFALYFKMAEQRLFGFDVDFWETFNKKLAGYWDVYLYAPDLRYANFNDMGEETFHDLWGINHQVYGGPNSDINALMENLAGGDPLLLWAADNGAPRFYWEGASPWFFLWRRGDAKPVAPDQKPKLQDAVLFRGAGQAVLQSDNLWMAYNAGWTSDKSHSNNDLGSFVLVAGKERLVIDPGYGDTKASDHSTIVINNEDQYKGKAGKYLNFGSGKSFHYLVTDVTEPYNPEYLQKFIRQILMVNGKYFVIVDEIEVKKSAPVEWRLQTRKPAEVLDIQNAVINGVDNQLFVINAADKTQTSIIPWKGKNGELNAVSKKPADEGNEHLLVTVLFPAEKGKYSNDSYPKASFKDGVLTVNDGQNVDDKITFQKQDGRWILKSVNREKDLLIPDASERNIEAFRNANKTAIDVKKLPAWFMPITN